MAWNGSGTFTRTNGSNTGSGLWAADAAAGTKITAANHDTHDEDIATALNACLTKNMETKPTADFVPNADATYDLGSAAAGWTNTYLTGDVVFDERADHAETPAAGKGQVWTRSDAPSALIFTDDAGTDHALSGQIVIKASDESIDTSTTLQDDDDLQVTLAANGVYEMESMLYPFSASSTPDVKAAWIAADGIAGGVMMSGTGTAAASELTWYGSTAVALALTGAGTQSIYWYKGLLRAGGAGGVFKLQWAQNVSDATATTMKAGSYLRVTKIG